MNERDHAVVVFHPTARSVVRVVGPVTLEEGRAIAKRTTLRTSVRPMWALEDAHLPIADLEVL